MFELQDLVKLILAIVLGGIIGVEREISHKPAGLRTNILICVGSMFYTVISIKLGISFRDPARIAAQIVTGIGFIGAGAIMKEGQTIVGLTTAASIWVVAAVGMGVGSGYYSLSMIVALGVLSIQLILHPLEPYIEIIKHKATYDITYNVDNIEINEKIKKIINELHLKLISEKITKKENFFRVEYYVIAPKRLHQEFISKILSLKEIIDFWY